MFGVSESIAKEFDPTDYSAPPTSFVAAKALYWLYLPLILADQFTFDSNIYSTGHWIRTIQSQ